MSTDADNQAETPPGGRFGGRTRAVARALTWTVGHAYSVVATALVVAVACALLYSWGRLRLTEAVYGDRLAAARREYESLRERFNHAVARTAVTELLVEGGRVSVVVRTCEGALRRIPTGFRASREIYVDYVVYDGRLWIRRVFDDATAPEQGVVIDPALAEVPWEDGRARCGKAVYRALGEGRWVVTVTGNGSLGLERAGPEAVPLSPAPPVAEFDELQQAAAPAQRAITLWDVLRAAFARGRSEE